MLRPQPPFGSLEERRNEHRLIKEFPSLGVSGRRAGKRAGVANPRRKEVGGAGRTGEVRSNLKGVDRHTIKFQICVESFTAGNVLAEKQLFA